MGNSKILLRTLIASLLLHLALVLLLPGMSAETPARPEVRLQLALQPPPQRSGTLTETPESARQPEPPPDASHLAEHDARAQNPEPAPDIDGRPRSVGDLELFDFRPADLVRAEARPEPTPSPPPSPAATDEASETSPDPAEPSPPATAEASAPATAEAAALAEAEPAAGYVATGESPVSRPSGDPAPPAASPPPPRPPAEPSASRSRPRHDSRRSGVRATGELSLSTYAWAWAPYLRELRDAINARWQPPLAFYMGLVEGEGDIFFRVLPDGSVARIEVVTETGHPSLVRAARNAVDHAAPFPPLPDDFPDPWLDVTWNYRYVILRR